MRLIDADALLENLRVLAPSAYQQFRRVIETAPTITVPVLTSTATTLTTPAEGDAISRSAAIAEIGSLEVHRFQEGGARLSNHGSVMRVLNHAPALPVPTDAVTVDDVVEGVEWFDGTSRYKIDKVHPWGSVDLDEWVLNIKSVAAMLNAAETISWPENHRLAKKEEPDLLEVAEDARLKLSLQSSGWARDLSIALEKAIAAERVRREK